MALLKVSSSLVNVDWLFNNLDHENLVILDATIPKLGQNPDEVKGGLRIQNSRFMDLKGDFCDTTSIYPNTFPSVEKFQKSAQELGINNQSCIVIYDIHGVYSSPRGWWLFKSMGHKNVAVLDGGLPSWVEAGYPTADPIPYEGKYGNFVPRLMKDLILDYQNVLDKLHDPAYQVVDARSEGRFHATAPEPRAGLRGGHIPGASNIPSKEVLSEGKLADADTIESLFKKANCQKKHVITSCGSGITACILALAADQVGIEDLSVFDGSWTEWAMREELPVEK